MNNWRLHSQLSRWFSVQLLLLLRLASTGASAPEPTPGSIFQKPSGMPTPAGSGFSVFSSPASSASSSSASLGQQAAVKGSFEWEQKRGERHDLEGTLVRTSGDDWKVTWNFKWGNQPVTYEGTVHGNLTSGSVSGTGMDAQKKRKFSFEGTAKDGVWNIHCFEITQGKKPQGIGELTLQK